MILENKPHEEVTSGDTAEFRRLCRVDDILAFANLSGNHNPLHHHARDGDGDGEAEAVVPGSMMAAVLRALWDRSCRAAGRSRAR